MITYTVEIDLDKDGTFNNSNGHISDRVLDANWVLGMPTAEAQIAQPLLASVRIQDPNLDFSQDVGTSPLAVKLRDMMIRIRASIDGGVVRTLVTGWITNVQSSDRGYGAETVIIFEDRMLQLQDAEFLPTFSTDVAISDEIQAVFDSSIVAYPYTGSYWILDASDLDSGTVLFDETFLVKETALTTLAFTGDAADRGTGVSAMGYINDIVIPERGGRFFVNRDGKFEFQNRNHDPSQARGDTITAQEFINFQLVQGVVYNEVVVSYIPRSNGTAGSVLYTNVNVPFLVEAGKTRTVFGRYYDPDNENANVGGRAMIDPVKATDYSAQLQVGGTDYTDSLRWRFDVGATGTKFTIDNPTSDNALVTLLRIRGTPVITYQDEQAQAIDPVSVQRYGRVPFPPIYARFMNTEREAQAWADSLLIRYGDPTTRYEGITTMIQSIEDTALDDLAERVLSKTIGNTVYITNAITGHAKDYVVAGERHFIRGGSHEVQWVLRPAAFGDVWVLDSSVLDTGTILA